VDFCLTIVPRLKFEPAYLFKFCRSITNHQKAQIGNFLIRNIASWRSHNSLGQKGICDPIMPPQLHEILFAQRVDRVIFFGPDFSPMNSLACKKLP